MIFVTVGNFNPFPRLVTAMVNLKTQERIAEEVFLQIGNMPTFSCCTCCMAQFVAPAEFETRIRQSSIIVAHGGCGTIIQALMAKKVPVVMPRRAEYGEHVDNHQVELTDVLAREGRIIPAYETEDLPAALEESRRRSSQPEPKPSAMVSLVSRAIDEMLARHARSGYKSADPRR